MSMVPVNENCNFIMEGIERDKQGRLTYNLLFDVMEDRTSGEISRVPSRESYITGMTTPVTRYLLPGL